MRFIYFLLISAIASSCGSPTREASKNLQQGTWRFSLIMQDTELPFTADLTFASMWHLEIKNASESIIIADTGQHSDSLFFEFPVYNASMKLFIDSDQLMTGRYTDHDKEDYHIPIIAEFGKAFRFTSSKSSTKTAARYHVQFGEPEQGYPAILLLDNRDGHLIGTFMTETGDYRFLEGNIMNGRVNLSTFDGSHVWLFDALIDGDSLKEGRFISGTHYHNPWKAVADSSFELKNPELISTLNPGFTQFEFALPNQEGQTMHHTDYIDHRRPVVYDIMGSWCPNCKDASMALDTIQDIIGREKVRIVSIAFERSDNLTEAAKRIDKMHTDLGLDIEILFGGKANKDNAKEKLPALSKLASYPTLVFCNKHGDVVRIYSGFYGPGTGQYYFDFISSTTHLLDSLFAAP